MNTFDVATAVTPQSSHTYAADFKEDWSIGSVPHGGYVTSCFLRVAAAHFSTTLARQDQPHTIALHLEFLRRTNTGPALFTVKDVKIGRATSTIHVTLTQGDTRDEVAGYIINSNIARESGVSFTTNWALHPAPPVATPSLFAAGKDSNWHEFSRLANRSFRKVTRRVRFCFPNRGQTIRGAIDQWMALAPVPLDDDEEPAPAGTRAAPGGRWTNASLGFVADMFPQLIDGFKEEEARRAFGDARFTSAGDGAGSAKYWYPTVLLNLDVKKALPEEGVEWLFSRVRAKSIKNGRFDLEVVILDEEGDIVALSHHVCLVLDASRNLAERKKGGGDGDSSKL